MQQSLTARLIGERGTKLLATRKGAIVVGVAAALLAAILLVVYLNRYRNSLDANAQPTQVLVATHLIAKGTPFATLAPEKLYELTTIPKSDVKEGAIVDPSTLEGKIAIADIYPGQQFTATDFTATPTSAVNTQITGAQRAIAISLDSTHGLIGQVQAGDHVDVYVGINLAVGGVETPVISLLYPNVTVLTTMAGGSGGVGSSNATRYILKLKTDQVPKVQYAADHGTLWLAARPTSGAKPSKPSIVTAQNLLFSKPVRIGGR